MDVEVERSREQAARRKVHGIIEYIRQQGVWHDEHDLIQKAVGWMLRELGKRVDEKILLNFLNQHYKKMPRTMLRYAIERLPETKRLAYLRGTI